MALGLHDTDKRITGDQGYTRSGGLGGQGGARNDDFPRRARDDRKAAVVDRVGKARGKLPPARIEHRKAVGRVVKAVVGRGGGKRRAWPDFVLPDGDVRRDGLREKPWAVHGRG